MVGQTESYGYLRKHYFQLIKYTILQWFEQNKFKDTAGYRAGTIFDFQNSRKLGKKSDEIYDSVR